MKVVFSGTLLRFVNYSKEVDLEAANLHECIGQLSTQFPSLKPVLLTGDGRVRDTHQLFLNGEQLASQERTNAELPLQGNDTLLILTAIAGG
ncbi:MAG: MoaD/ThiS family protein [Kofleriaceae bacterium]|jgi:molybdopterin synthase sulfur carrier subunit